MVTEALTRVAQAASAAPTPFEETQAPAVELQAATVRRKPKRSGAPPAICQCCRSE